MISRADGFLSVRKTRRAVGSALFVIAIGLAATTSWGVTLRVPSEFATIQAGVDAAAAGDTVLVAPGTYSDSSGRIVGGVFTRAGVHLKDGVALVSESGPGATSIDMLESLTVQYAVDGFGLPSSDTLVQGFTITGTVPGLSAARVSQSGRVTWRDCVWRETDGAGTPTGSMLSAFADILLEECSFQSCANVGGIAAGPVVYDGSLTARNCVFQDLLGAGIGADADFTPRDLIIEDCTFLRCRGGIGAQGFNGTVQIARCTFVECETPVGGGGIGLGGGNSMALIEDNLFWKCGVTGGGSSGGGIRVGQPCLVRRNTLFECFGGSSVGGMSVSASTFSLTFTNNVVVGSIGPGAAVRGVAGISTGDCNVFFNNPGGNAVGYVLGPRDRDIDPLFCDPVNGDFTVNAASPCLPPNSLGCDFIGAFPQGCGTISTAPKSWGQIKGIYR